MKAKYLQAYMDMLLRFAETSEAKRLKVAACLIKDNNPITFGINGTPEGWYTNECEDQDGNTAWFTRHAEQACLDRMLKRTESTEGCIMLVTHAPCKLCALRIKTAGITEVYYKHTYRDLTGVQYLLDNNVTVKQLS